MSIDGEVFDIGDRPIITVTFRDEAGTLTSPSTVVFGYVKPDGTEVVGQSPLDNPSTGVFRYRLPTLDAAGVWTWRGKGTAGLIAADEGSFTVRPSAFAAP